MRKSKAITLALLGAGMLASCAVCGCPAGHPHRRVFYDRNRNPVPRERWYGPDGKPAELYDENGNPVPAGEVAAAYSGSSSSYRSHRSGWGFFPFFWGGGRSGGWYRPGGSTYYGGSRPSAGTSTSRPTAGGPVSRGGFGRSGGFSLGG